MRAVILGLALVAGLSGHASAQAFGLSMGQKLDEIAVKQVSADDPTHYVITPPEPDAAFQTYKAYVYPETGLCEVDGYGPALAGPAGAKAAIAYQVKMAAALDKSFGAGAEDIYGDGSATSTIEEDLLAANVSVQRLYTKDANTLPDGISSVVLFLQSEEGIPQVSAAYIFDNEDACMAARDAAIDSAPN